MSTQHWFSRAIKSEEGIYGLVVASGVIATAGGSRPSALFTLMATAITVIVFWAAHVYAGTVASHGAARSDGSRVSLASSVLHSLGRSSGMLAATLLPALVLLFGVLGVLDDAMAIWLSLWSIVGALAVLGYLAYQRRGTAWYWRLVGAVATASFGIVIILAKVAITH